MERSIILPEVVTDISQIPEDMCSVDYSDELITGLDISFTKSFLSQDEQEIVDLLIEGYKKVDIIEMKGMTGYRMRKSLLHIKSAFTGFNERRNNG